MLTSTAWPEGAAALERILCLAEAVSSEREARDHRRIFGHIHSAIAWNWDAHAPFLKTNVFLGAPVRASAHKALTVARLATGIEGDLQRLAHEGAALPGLARHGLAPVVHLDLVGEGPIQGALGFHDKKGHPDMSLGHTRSGGTWTLSADSGHRAAAAAMLDAIDTLCAQNPQAHDPWWVLARPAGQKDPNDLFPRLDWVGGPLQAATNQDARTTAHLLISNARGIAFDDLLAFQGPLPDSVARPRPISLLP